MNDQLIDNSDEDDDISEIIYDEGSDADKNKFEMPKYLILLTLAVFYFLVLE